MNEFTKQFDAMQEAAFENSKAHGFHEGQANFGEKIALIHAELSEALEANRKGNNPQSEHIPQFTAVTEELADVVIRCMDLAGSMYLPLAEAIVAKHEYNKSRPFKHGKKF